MDELIKKFWYIFCSYVDRRSILELICIIIIGIVLDMFLIKELIHLLN